MYPRKRVSPVSRQFPRRIALACLLFVAGSARAIDINRDGSTDDPAAPFGDNLHWSSPGNWDLDAAPNGAIFDAFIGANGGFPAGVTVEHDAASTAIGSLTLGNSSTLRLDDNTLLTIDDFAGGTNATVQLNPGSTLTLNDTAGFNGLINGQGGNLTTTTNAGTTLGNRTRFAATAGSVIQVDATAYSAIGLNDNTTLMSADGAGSSLDLSALTSIDDGFTNTSGIIRTHTIQATDSGSIDLSGVTQITGPGDDERLNINANSGGSIDLSGLQTVTGSSSSAIRMQLTGDSTLRLGRVFYAQEVDISSTGGGDLIDILGDARLLTGTTLVAADDATVEVGERFSYRHTNEANVNLGQPGNTGDAGDNPRGATVRFDGAGGQQLVEAGGLDFSTLTDLLNNGNFGFGQMVVGTPGQATEVVLLDIADNGNRAGGFEAVYLYGNGNGDGLVINNGSTLVLNDLNVYASIGGTLTHINALFGAGQTLMPFGGGTIELRKDPTTPGDVNADGVVDAGDIDLQFEAVLGQSPHARFNLNADGSLDSADVDQLVQVILGTDYGDTDLDGDIDTGDLTLAITNFTGRATSANAAKTATPTTMVMSIPRTSRIQSPTSPARKRTARSIPTCRT